MPDEVTDPNAGPTEINPNPQDVGDLTDAQMDEILAGTGPEFHGEEEITVGEEDPDGEDEDAAEGEDAEEGEPEADEDDEADADNDDAADDSDGDDGDDDAEESEGDGLDPAVREQIEGVLQRVEIMEAERERLTAELEREKLLRDRNAGKLGALMQQIKAGDGDAAGETDDSDDGDAERRPSRDPEVESELQEIRSGRVQTAIANVSQEFLEENNAFFQTLQREAGDEAAKQFTADLVTSIKTTQDALGDDIFAMNPKLAAKVARTVIRSAFADTKLNLMREFQNRAAEASEESRRNIRARKKGSAGARTNKHAAANQISNKSLSDMSDAELEKALANASFDDE
jgi:hypothetical protein